MPEAFETGGIHAGKIVLVGITIAVTVALAAAVAWLAWTGWLPADHHGAPNAALDFEVAPPRLESAPQNDHAVYMTEKERLLHGYRWLDRDAGIARIPIEQAMQILAQQAGEAPPAAEQRP